MATIRITAGASATGATTEGDLLAVANLLVFTGYFLLAKRVREDVHSWSILAAVFVDTTVVVSIVGAWVVFSPALSGDLLDQ